MEVEKNDCYRCKQNYENPIELSCKHHMCQKCLTRTILKKNLTELQDKDTFIIPCKCKNGDIELTLSKMGEIIKQNLELSAIKCKNHELDCIKFCKECNKFLCEKCIQSHTDLFTDHTVTNVTDSNNKPISITGLNEKCPKHNKDFSSYCKNCKVSFCTICLNEEEVIKPHEGHEIVPYKNYFDKVIEISNKLQFKNYEECKEHINQIEGEFDKQYKENLSKTVKSLENTIEILTKTLDIMKTSERVLEFLRQQGFCPEVDPDNGNIVFKYQMRTFIYINNDEDEDFFQLALPGIMDVTEDNRELVLEAANKTNFAIKVIKCCIPHDDVWVFFEILLDSSPEVQDIIPRALAILQGAQQQFYQKQ